MKNVQVPVDFVLAPFYKEKDVLRYDNDTSIEGADMFLFEIAAKEDIDLYEPWAEKEVSIPIVLKLWKGEKETISSLFRERKRNKAKVPMIVYTARFLSALFWLNETYISSLQQWKRLLNTLQLKPVNITERFEFILGQPDHYHSFIQLSQIYEETEKLFEKRIIMQKKHLLK